MYEELAGKIHNIRERVQPNAKETQHTQGWQQDSWQSWQVPCGKGPRPLCLFGPGRDRGLGLEART